MAIALRTFFVGNMPRKQVILQQLMKTRRDWVMIYNGSLDNIAILGIKEQKPSATPLR
jgi:hypothetical protein